MISRKLSKLGSFDDYAPEVVTGGAIGGLAGAGIGHLAGGALSLALSPVVPVPLPLGVAAGGLVHSKMLGEGKGREFAGKSWQELEGVTDPDVAKQIIAKKRSVLGAALGGLTGVTSGAAIGAGVGLAKDMKNISERELESFGKKWQTHFPY